MASMSDELGKRGLIDLADELKHLASLRQCKSCSRKNATTKFVFDECVVYRCRYCKHETSYTRITFSDC